MFQTKVVEKTKTHILHSVIFFPENRTVYEIIWENGVERGRPYMTIWRMRIACRIPKATHTHTHTHTHTKYTILIVFPLQQWLHQHISMLRHTYIAGLRYFIVSFRVKMARYFGKILGASVFYFAYNKIAFFVCLSVSLYTGNSSRCVNTFA